MTNAEEGNKCLERLLHYAAAPAVHCDVYEEPDSGAAGCVRSPITPWNEVRYIVALAIPTAMMLIGTRAGMPAFMFEHLTILFVVGTAVLWGMGPSVLAAFTAALAQKLGTSSEIRTSTMPQVSDLQKGKEALAPKASSSISAHDPYSTW